MEMILKFQSKILPVCCYIYFRHHIKQECFFNTGMLKSQNDILMKNLNRNTYIHISMQHNTTLISIQTFLLWSTTTFRVLHFPQIVTGFLLYTVILSL